MPANPESSQKNAFSAMGKGRYNYDACHAYHEKWGLFGLHCHDFYEFYIHHHGAKYFCVDSRVYPLEENHLVVVPPFLMHGLIGDTIPTDYERSFLYISPDMLKACGADQLDLEQFITQHMSSSQHHFRLTGAEADECRRLLSRLMEMQNDPDHLTQLENCISILQFLHIICRVMKRSQDLVEPIVVNKVTKDILSYVNENYASPFRLEDIARRFNVSVSFLSHEFVRYTGRSVYDYVLYRRILLAQKMIHTGQPFNEIAYCCGFNDYSSFLRAFTKTTGMSPSAYRKANRPLRAKAPG